jgi:RND family efflux transporter MFP subunit
MAAKASFGVRTGSFRRQPSRVAAALAGVALMVALAACGDQQSSAPPPLVRAVQAIKVERKPSGETVTLTGQVKAQDTVSLAFRIDGKMLERRVSIGDHVAPGEIVAQLDEQNQQHALRSAQADLAAARAGLGQAIGVEARQRELLGKGFTTQVSYESGKQQLESSRAQVDSAEARLRTAQDQLAYTTLQADAAGTVTAKGAEPGEVVRAGQMIVQVARQGGRDALFNVPAQLIRIAPRDPVVDVALSDDPTIHAKGRVREVSPEADPATRTFQVKVGLIDPPAAMRLGATVTGTTVVNPAPVIEIPATALTEANGRPAVWMIDSANDTVELHNIEIGRYGPNSVIVAQGLEDGDTVVTAGVHTLRPGQKVRIAGTS